MFFTRTQVRCSLCSWRFWFAFALTLGFLIYAARSFDFSSSFFRVEEEAVVPCSAFLILLYYVLGFYWWLPEITGLPSKSPRHDLLRRWTQLASVASAVVSVLLLKYLIEIATKAWPLEIVRTVIVVGFCISLPILWTAASTRYLEWVWVPESPEFPPARLLGFNASHKWQNAVLRPFKPASCLAAGALLIFLALFFRSYSGTLFRDFSGWDVKSRLNALIDPTNNLLSSVHPAIAVALRALPILGVSLAGLAILSFSSNRVRSILRRSSAPAASAGALCLAVFIENLILILDPRENAFISMFLGIIPVLIWLRASKQSDDEGLHTHMFLCFVFLPLFMLWILPFAVSVYIAPSHGSFTLGLFLLWWGFAQCRCPARGMP